jgi:hypothetical protein
VVPGEGVGMDSRAWERPGAALTLAVVVTYAGGAVLSVLVWWLLRVL